MDELDFYRLLRQYLPRNNQVIEDLYKEVDIRLNKLEREAEKDKWKELCNLVEATVKKFEAQNDDLVNVNVTFDECIIMIDNND